MKKKKKHSSFKEKKLRVPSLPLTLFLIGFRLCRASPWESNKAVSSMSDKDRTFSISDVDKSLTPVTPSSSFVRVKFWVKIREKYSH